MRRLINLTLCIILMNGCTEEKDWIKQGNVYVPRENRSLDNKLLSITDSNSSVQATSFYSCEYFPPTDPRSCNYDPGAGEGTTTIFPVIRCLNGILSFSKQADFYRTYFLLDSLVENFGNYDFALNLYGGDVNKIDSLLDSYNIDEDQPLIDFENRYLGFVSLRNNLTTQENNYLNLGGDPSSMSNPDNRFYISDDIFRTLLSVNGVIKIENIYIKYFPNGVCYAVLNGSTALLNQLTDDYAYVPYTADTVNVKLLTTINDLRAEEMPGDVNRINGEYCKLWYKKISPPVYYNGGKSQYFSKISVHNTFVFDGAGSVIKHYRLNSRGKWKRSRNYLAASIYDSYCSIYSKDKAYRYRKQRRATKVSQTVLPIAGQMLQGIMWFGANIIGNSNGWQGGYSRYFKTASNYGYFYGDNYCNGQRQKVEASW